MKQRSTKPLVKKRKVVHIVPRTWFGRLVAPIAATTLLLLAILFFTFFFTIFIAVLGVLGIILIAGTLWAVFESKGGPSIDVKYHFEKEEGRPQDSSGNQLPDER